LKGDCRVIERNIRLIKSPVEIAGHPTNIEADESNWIVSEPGNIFCFMDKPYAVTILKKSQAAEPAMAVCIDKDTIFARFNAIAAQFLYWHSYIHIIVLLHKQCLHNYKMNALADIENVKIRTKKLNSVKFENMKTFQKLKETSAKPSASVIYCLLLFIIGNKHLRPLSDCRMLGAPNVKKISSSFDATSSAHYDCNGHKMQNFVK
ncbi:hypothetical protein T12_9613, partial [Trichinella patagoniensis]